MPRVLIVDDEPDSIIVLQRLCRSCGADVVAVSDADAARAALREHEFDLLLLDLQLPRQEGLPLIAEIERDPRLAPKAVVVTGFSVLAPVFTNLPVIDKGRLVDLSEFLKKMLTAPPAP